MAISKFKTGDVIRVRADLREGDWYNNAKKCEARDDGSCYVTEDMARMAGKCVTVGELCNQGAPDACFMVDEIDDCYWRDAMFEEEIMFGKDDLQTGDLVERRNGDLMLVMRDCEHVCRDKKADLLLTKDGYSSQLNGYGRDLTCKGYKDGDIVRVYRGYAGDAFRKLRGEASLPGDGTLRIVWERDAEKVSIKIGDSAELLVLKETADKIREQLA